MQTACNGQVDQLIASLQSFVAKANSPNIGYHIHVLSDGTVQPHHLAFLSPLPSSRPACTRCMLRQQAG